VVFKRSWSRSAAPDVSALPAGTPLISTRGVEKAYSMGPGQTYVLRRITLDIKPGEFVSIMGPSGAGKSTLLHILGMHSPRSSARRSRSGTSASSFRATTCSMT
jgi:ABC-type lipoprotein export system ATPase subunit